MKTYKSYKDSDQVMVVHLPREGKDDRWKSLGKGAGHMPTVVSSDKEYPEKFKVIKTPEMNKAKE